MRGHQYIIVCYSAHATLIVRFRKNVRYWKISIYNIIYMQCICELFDRDFLKHKIRNAYLNMQSAHSPAFCTIVLFVLYITLQYQNKCNFFFSLNPYSIKIKCFHFLGGVLKWLPTCTNNIINTVLLKLSFRLHDVI